jgi:HPt (histidine-containing phosphotransfer) domain-containing protein
LIKEESNMTVKECYEQFGGDYEGVSRRLMTDDRILKFLMKFKDMPDYQQLMDALKQEDYELAFRTSHNLKGVGLNLGLTGLQKESHDLCEMLRGGKPTADISGMVSAVEEEYNKVIDAIKMLS